MKSLNTFYCNGTRSLHVWNINFSRYTTIGYSWFFFSSSTQILNLLPFNFSPSPVYWHSFKLTFLTCFYKKSCRLSPRFLASFFRLVLNIWRGQCSSYRESIPVLHGQAKVEPNLAQKASRPSPACTMTSRRRMSQSATGLFLMPCCLQCSQCYFCAFWPQLLSVEHPLPQVCSRDDYDI